MWEAEDLLGCLTELVDLHLGTRSFQGIDNRIHINGIFVGQGVKQVVCLHSFFPGVSEELLLPGLFVAKNEIDPFVQVLANVLTL